MKYTKSKKANEKVQEDLNIIKKIIIKKIRPISIILFGGFGKGEGSFEIVNGKVLPLNDYDLYVITKRKISDKVLEQVGIECSKAIGRGGKEFADSPLSIYDKNEFFHVDLRYLLYSQLGKMKRTNRTFELKYGSTIIYGEDIREKINDVKLPISEAIRCLMIPACHLLLCMDSRRLKEKYKKDEKMFSLHHISKTYLACASSLLISSGKFYAYYQETNSAFQKIYGKKFPELAERIDEATKFKITPRKDVSKSIRKKWFQARDDLIFCINYFAKKQLNIEAKNIKELAKKMYGKLPYSYFTPYLPFGFFSRVAFPMQYLLNLLYFKRSHYFKVLLNWRDVGIKIAMSSLLLLKALDDKTLLKESAKYIKTFAPVKSESWKDLRVALLYAFNRYFSQKLI